MQHQNTNNEALTMRPQIGRLLLDAELITSNELARAMEQQSMSDEPLGKILEDMAALDHAELSAALSVQGSLSSVDNMIAMAAGPRENLGALLIHAKRIDEAQLAAALSEQLVSGEKLGDIFIRKGWLTPAELEAILAFQTRQNHKGSDSTLQLGHLLVSAGHINNDQLDLAVARQLETQQRLGDVLVESGYAGPEVVAKGLRLQSKLMGAVLSTLLCVTSLMDSKPAIAAEGTPVMLASVAVISAVVADSSSASRTQTPEATYDLAMKYLEGKGVERNRARAMELLIKSANAGLASAQYSLGLMYADDEEDDLAFKWIKKAVDQEHDGAKYAYNYMMNQDFGTGC